MPRRMNDKQQQKRTTTRREQDRPPARRVQGRQVDEQVLVLRETGASFSSIARSLDLARAADAHRSFLRAISGSTGDERRRLVTNEEARLDQLERRIRQRDAADPLKIERRLLGVTKFREAIR